MISAIDRLSAAWRAFRGSPAAMATAIPQSSAAQQGCDDAAPELGKLFMLGGKPFRAIDFDRRTALIDHYLMSTIRRLGLDKVVPMDGEDDKAYLIRVQAAIIDSGRVQDLIAGFIVPDGTSERQWTPELARKTSKHIALCDTQDDRELILDLSIEAVFAFFVQGAERLKRFLVYSQAMETAAVQAPKRPH